MNNVQGELNDRLELRVTTDLIGEYGPELAAFLRQLGLGHLLYEVLTPLSATARTKAVVAFEERPWPPSGIGARTLRAVQVAVAGADGQALCTPSFLSPQHATNVGLATAATKLLFDDLSDDGVEWVSFFVNGRSAIVPGELARVGFVPRQARVVTHETEFIAYTASPSEALKGLGLDDVRLGDVLSLNFDQQQVSLLTSFHLSLAAGIAAHWAGDTRWADVFPGFDDLLTMSPPSGITGTPGPATPADPIIVPE
ncbi:MULTISPECIES: hypothetical protein [Streptomyces]|uniref:hypothetical protein n=1 Tax=Streptomyces TaxID=1883 RepID=UPI002E1656C5|nr:hypothetical protein OHB30_43090 [Streptomyces europaeiscabiei]WSZ61807.1 hypothetical protein OH824_37195 [Streptomyces canus]